MTSVNSCLNFNGNCEVVSPFYQSVFGGELQNVRCKDLDDQMELTGEALSKMGKATPLLDGYTLLYGGDVPAQFSKTAVAGNQFQFNLDSRPWKKPGDCSKPYRTTVKLYCLCKKLNGLKSSAGVSIRSAFSRG